LGTLLANMLRWTFIVCTIPAPAVLNKQLTT